MKQYAAFRHRIIVTLLYLLPIATLMTTVTLLYGQICPGCGGGNFAFASIPNPDWTIRKAVNEVYLVFAASTGAGFVSDLRASDISILDDAKPPEAIVAFYTQHDLPMRIGLLIDISGSVYLRFGFEQAAAGTFLRQVVRPQQDMAFVMGFSDSFELTQHFTNNPGQLWHGVTTLVDNNDSTALFDAVIEGCGRLRSHPEDQFVARALIILSDGVENASRATLEDAIRAAQQSDVTIYTINTRAPSAHAKSLGGDRKLKELAEETGGRALSPGPIEEFQSAFALIAEELHSDYAISYRPADFKLDGHYRRIQVRAQKSGETLRIRARKGYYALSPAQVPDVHRFVRFENP